ncbi:MAG: 2-oxo acid dehydrogenase subunit E2 [Gammaproteobacteria bacterium]|nr:2-oxo acid dehydrogenase subunit E2 [Gammaproteobacteria bacterium]MDH4311487.1 2-oxo acid dehydrogenase subunit E2 [Gammaproteobacteria bacterium]MDH5273030.1 2-oxo acid dehydrogenase subunit E2 [Gammaproteobacteria bacterium]
MSTERIRPVTMPKWGIEMQEGTVTAWQFELGRHVDKGDALLDVETEKIVNSVESPASGTLRRMLAGTGDTLPVGALVAVLSEPDVADAEIDAFVRDFKPFDASFAEGSTAAAMTPSASAAPAALAADTAADGAAEGEARVSPIARRLAEKLGIDLSHVTGTGRNGRISKEDVEAYAATLQHAGSPPAASAVAATGAAEPMKRERLTSMRSTIARRLSESKRDLPHYRLVADLDMDALANKRAAMVAAGESVSINDLLLHAVATALRQHPRLNAQFTGEELLQFEQVDLAVAVATPGGLVTPIVRNAAGLPVGQIAVLVRELAERARAGKLARDEITGGTFTVSNLGMFGVRQFDAIINPPQVAILAIGAMEERPVVRHGALAVGRVVTVTLSSDHRVVDGADAAAFLATLRATVAGVAAG